MHGGVGIFLRIEDPDKDVHEAHHPLHNLTVGGPGRVKVRQVQKDQPGVVVGEPFDRCRSVALSDLQPIQQRITALDAPNARQRLGGGRPAHGRRRDLLAAYGIEKR
ncbi:hypothetical protein NicSoilC12_28200 [Arthrobacter sp. NicSoilC12]|nr:hypothetical protein NicSoilC12_28200 [Arthrobacter sp. NicSoilC12]